MARECTFCMTEDDQKHEKGCPIGERRKKVRKLFGREDSQDIRVAMDEICAPAEIALIPDQAYNDAHNLWLLGYDEAQKEEGARRYLPHNSFKLGIKARLLENGAELLESAQDINA